MNLLPQAAQRRSVKLRSSKSTIILPRNGRPSKSTILLPRDGRLLDGNRVVGGPQSTRNLPQDSSPNDDFAGWDGDGLGWDGTGNDFAPDDDDDDPQQINTEYLQYEDPKVSSFKYGMLLHNRMDGYNMRIEKSGVKAYVLQDFSLDLNSGETNMLNQYVVVIVVRRSFKDGNCLYGICSSPLCGSSSSLQQ